MDVCDKQLITAKLTMLMSKCHVCLQFEVNQKKVSVMIWADLKSPVFWMESGEAVWLRSPLGAEDILSIYMKFTEKLMNSECWKCFR